MPHEEGARRPVTRHHREQSAARMQAHNYRPKRYAPQDILWYRFLWYRFWRWSPAAGNDRLLFGIIAAVVCRRDRLDRIECGKTDEARQEAADMRLPGDRLFHTRHADRGDSEQEVDAEPDEQ